jgi:hypothetical protein
MTANDLPMYAFQWAIAAITAIFVAVVAFLQWSTAQQKAVLDLFERREAIYQVVRKAVSTIAANAAEFDPKREVEFLQAMERAYFFFGDDVVNYLRQLWDDITQVQTADAELKDEHDSAARGRHGEKASRSDEPHHSIPLHRTAAIRKIHAIFAGRSDEPAALV